MHESTTKNPETNRKPEAPVKEGGQTGLSEMASPMNTGLRHAPPGELQHRVVAIQRTIGNSGVQRMIGQTAPKGVLQRQDSGGGNDLSMLLFDPPAALSQGRLPGYAAVQDLGGSPSGMADDLINQLPDRSASIRDAFESTEFTTAATLRNLFNNQMLLPNAQAIFSEGGWNQNLQECGNWLTRITSSVNIRAELANVRFERATGVTMNVTHSGDASVTGGGSTSNGTEAGVEVGGENGSVNASGSSGTTSEGGTSLSGNSSYSLSDDATCFFTFDIIWHATLTYQGHAQLLTTPSFWLADLLTSGAATEQRTLEAAPVTVGGALLTVPASMCIPIIPQG